MQRYIGLLIVMGAFLLCGPAVAAAGGAITLSDAIVDALIVSPEVELARMSVQEAEIALKEAEIDQLAGRPRSELIEAERSLDEARSRFVDTLSDVALKVQEAYYQVLRTGELLALQQRNEEQAERQYAVAKTRYDAGIIAHHEYLDVELRREQAAHQRLAAERNHENAILRLADMIGADPSEGLQLASTEAPPFTPLSLTLDEAIAEAEASSSDIAQAERGLEAAERNLELAQSTFAPPVELTRAEIARKRAEIRLLQAIAAVRADVRQSYHELTSAATDVALKERSLDLALRRLEIARARYDAGTIPLLDLVGAEAAHMQAGLDATGAVWDYNLAAARFLRKIGRIQLPPLPPSIEEFMSGW